MNFELFTLQGYGHFVWPAFIFTFLICAYLYKKTKEEFIKQEKKYLSEVKQFNYKEVKIIKDKKKHKENFIWHLNLKH